MLNSHMWLELLYWISHVYTIQSISDGWNTCVVLQSIKNSVFLWKDSTLVRQLSRSNVNFILCNWKNQWEWGLEECVKIFMNVEEIIWLGDSLIWLDLRKTFKIVNILVNKIPWPDHQQLLSQGESNFLFLGYLGSPWDRTLVTLFLTSILWLQSMFPD